MSILLTKVEISELQACLANLLPGSDHEHLSADEYKKEITVCLYDEAQMEGLSERARKLIKEDS